MTLRLPITAGETVTLAGALQIIADELEDTFGRLELAMMSLDAVRAIVAAEDPEGPEAA